MEEDPVLTLLVFALMDGQEEVVSVSLNSKTDHTTRRIYRKWFRLHPPNYSGKSRLGDFSFSLHYLDDQRFVIATKTISEFPKFQAFAHL